MMDKGRHNAEDAFKISNGRNKCFNTNYDKIKILSI